MGFPADIFRGCWLPQLPKEGNGTVNDIRVFAGTVRSGHNDLSCNLVL